MQTNKNITNIILEKTLLDFKIIKKILKKYLTIIL
jgi:hypothetical protein